LDSRFDTIKIRAGKIHAGKIHAGIRSVGTFSSGFSTPLGYEFGDQIATFRDGARDDPLRPL
jgi:hypothetical protein